MGMNQYTKQQYANREFLLNTLEYLVGNGGILETRGKEYTLRVLDKSKYGERKGMWQFINIALPVLIVMAFIALYQFLRRKKYAR
jgi:hypothetical protein